MKALCVALLLALGCDTDECAQLAKLKLQHERALADVRARAALKEQTMARMSKLEARSKETMARLGLDLPETKLKEALDARVAKIPGATVERTTKQVAGVEDGGAIHETLWRIKYGAKSDAEAFERMRAIAADPPLFQVVTLIKDAKGSSWTLELMRASVVEVPMNIKATELPPLKTAKDVGSELGFCGASELRAELEKMEAEFAKLKVEAEELSVVMPKMATYEGLERRADMLGKIEAENRILMNAFFSATEKAKVRFRAIGAEKEVVIYEFVGGQADRKRVEKHLPEDVLKSMKELDSADKSVIRLSAVNRVADHQIKHRSGGLRPGVGLAPQKP